METLMVVVAGVHFTVGTYLILSKSVIRIIVGTAVFSNGVHLLILTLGGLKKGASPLLGETATSYTDPLPQALILTSIVISFALTAFLFVLGYRVYTELGTDDTEKLKGSDDE